MPRGFSAIRRVLKAHPHGTVPPRSRVRPSISTSPHRLYLQAMPQNNGANGKRYELKGSGVVHVPPVPISSAESARPIGRLHHWMVYHDDSRLFLVGFVVLSIVLTLWISLFWLIVMVGLHFALECVKKHYDGAGRPLRIVAWALWDTKLDLLLVVIALVLALYTSVTLGVAGAGGATRLSVFGFRLSRLTRVGHSLRGLRGLRLLLPLPMKDVVLASRIACVRKLDRREILKRRAEVYIRGPHDRARARRIASVRYPWHGRWTVADKLALVFFVLNLGALVVGVFIAQEPAGEVLANLAAHLRP